jgi:hypothetical protein
MSELPKPGCWGFAITYSDDDPVCNICAFKQSCGPVALETRQRLVKLLEHRGISCGVPKLKSVVKPADSVKMTLTKTTERKTVEDKSTKVNAADPVADKPASPFANKKADHYAHRLAAKGIDLKQVIKSGSVPTGVAKFIPVGVQHVIDNNGVNKSKLTGELMSQLKWSKGTAASHVSILVALFYGLGVIDGECVAVKDNV